MEFCHQHQIALLTMDSEEYPELLRSVYAPPVLLTAKGNIELLKSPLMLSVVGTRNPSLYTLDVENAVIEELSKLGFVIVSGFAKGVDAAAHSAALRYGSSTVAVLGCGVNVNYPRENVRLREEMLSTGRGLFLSEYLPGTEPLPANFPRRNRILSGLSHATAVMEAADRSGSLITANLACDQGRSLLCVPPGNLFDRRYAGVIPFLRDGAIPLMSYQDVLMVYYTHLPHAVSVLEEKIRESETLIYKEKEEEKAAAEQRASVSKPVSAPESPLPSPEQHAPQKPEPAAEMTAEPESEEGKQIVRYLRENGETYADDIADALDMDLSALLSDLTVLELDGYVQTLFGKRYRAAEAMSV